MKAGGVIVILLSLAGAAIAGACVQAWMGPDASIFMRLLSIPLIAACGAFFGVVVGVFSILGTFTNEYRKGKNRGRSTEG